MEQTTAGGLAALIGIPMLRGGEAVLGGNGETLKGADETMSGANEASGGGEDLGDRIGETQRHPGTKNLSRSVVQHSYSLIRGKFNIIKQI